MFYQEATFELFCEAFRERYKTRRDSKGDIFDVHQKLTYVSEFPNGVIEGLNSGLIDFVNRGKDSAYHIGNRGYTVLLNALFGEDSRMGRHLAGLMITAFDMSIIDTRHEVDHLYAGIVGIKIEIDMETVFLFKDIFDTVKKTRVLQDRTTLVEVEVKYPQLPSIFNFEDNVNDINSRLPALLEEANGTLRPVSIIINQQGISFYFSKWWEKSDRFEELCGASDEQREKFIQRTEKAYCWMDNGFHAKMVERFGTEQYSYQIMTVDFKSVFGTYYLAYPDRKKFVYMVEAERYMKKLIASIESLKQEDLEKDSATIFLSRTPFNQDSVEGVFSSVVAECLDDIRAMFPQYAFSRQSSGSNLLLVVNLKQPD